MDEKLIGRVTQHLEQEADLRLAILFGSYATGRASTASDIDIAVAYDHKLSMDERIEIAQKLSATIRKEIDLVDLLSASGVLLQQIISQRKTLVNRDGELYGNIIAKRVAEEADFMPFMQ